MTHRDYEIIAGVLREESRATVCERTILAGITGRLADAMVKQNPRFKRARFFKACGLEGAE